MQIHVLPTSVTDLPVMQLASDVIEALSTHDVLLRAEPGAGKSTGLPLALLLNSTPDTHIILLEPRRLAARSVASRLASHLGEAVGGRVGLRMRSDTRVSKETRLTVVTEGVLTRMLQSDPALEGISVIIFDEFHERSLHADLGLALCLEVQQALRTDLRLLLMSATLDASPLTQRLKDVVQFHCSVRQHPVDTHWVGEPRGALEPAVLSTVLTALEQHQGDVLVFLPGVAEITRCARLLQSRLPNAIELHSLHSGVSIEAQMKATAAASQAVRRVILSTSLAETSVTIDGVCVVVDSGLERRSKLDPVTGAQRLETVMASQASATQRAGRAGRTSAGACYRLWNESGHTRRAAHWQPEILRADLTALTLELSVWGASNANELDWLDPPPPAAIARAEALLSELGLWHEGQLTRHGKHVAALPLHPRLGHMLVWAHAKGAGAAACAIAAALDEPTRNSRSVDLEPLLNAQLPSGVKRRARQLASLLPSGPGSSQASQATQPVSASVLLAQAYPDWIAQRRPGDAGAYRLACGAGVVISADDTLAHAPWLVVVELGGTGQQLRVFKALEVNLAELEAHSPECFTTRKHVDWDHKLQRVVAESRVMLGQLVVSARPMQDISDEERSAGLLAGIRKLGLECLPWTDECREWQARVQRMRDLHIHNHHGGTTHADGPHASQTTPPWPAVDDHALLNSLEHWLLPWLGGLGSIKALRQLNLHKVLTSLLDYRQQARLDEWLPLRYQVPSGSKIALSYLRAGNPVLSVRLQEMLGCKDNPSIANGEITLKVELLSPARRPVQVTTDLKGFWSNSYPEVRKEMAGRYPKHVWPDDPINAQPTTRTKGR
jgi:ATP-dependent helicase HrpB